MSKLHLLAIAVLLSAAGDLLAMVALALQVHELTGSAAAVSAFFAASTLPVILLAPVAGLLTDRAGAVPVLGLASAGQAVVALALAFTAGELAAVLALSALLSAGSALSQPAEFSLVPALCKKGDGPLACTADLAKANGLMEAARYAGFAAGPLLGAALLAGAGLQAALLIDAASFAVIAAVAVALRGAHAPPADRDARPRAREGLELLWSDATLRATVPPAVAALLCMSAVITAEVFYVKDVLGAGDAVYALVTAAWMAGMVAGALGLAGRVPAPAMAAVALGALTVQGIGIAAVTAWAVVPVAVAGWVVGGLGHGLKNTLLRTLIGLRVPARAHGRAFAAYNAARNAAELGALAGGGLLVTAVGARSAVLIAGLGPIAAGVGGLAVLRRARERRVRGRVTDALTAGRV